MRAWIGRLIDRWLDEPHHCKADGTDWGQQVQDAAAGQRSD